MPLPERQTTFRLGFDDVVFELGWNNKTKVLFDTQ